MRVTGFSGSWDRVKNEFVKDTEKTTCKDCGHEYTAILKPQRRRLNI